MIYLSGAASDALAEAARHAPIGLMLQPGNSYWSVVGDYPHYAIDNGCYSQGARFRLERYLSWLDTRVTLADRCLFATAPDVWGDWAATWARSAGVLPQLRARGLRAAVCLQDGFSPIAADWSAFDAVLIGGTDPWRASPACWRAAAEARRRGKWVHLGRVNSRRRLIVARAMGCHSADGTFTSYAPDRYAADVARWLGDLTRQPGLPEVAV